MGGQRHLGYIGACGGYVVTEGYYAPIRYIQFPLVTRIIALISHQRDGQPSPFGGGYLERVGSGFVIPYQDVLVRAELDVLVIGYIEVTPFQCSRPKIRTTRSIG